MGNENWEIQRMMEAYYDRLKQEDEENLREFDDEEEEENEEDADEIYERNEDPMTKYDRWRDEQKDKEVVEKDNGK